MRLIWFIIPFVVSSTTAAAQDTRVELNIEREAYINETSFQEILADQFASACTQGQNLPPIVCAVATDHVNSVAFDNAIRSRDQAITQFNNPSSLDNLYRSAHLLFAAQFVVYRQELAQAQSTEDREIAFSGLSQLHDYLSPLFAQMAEREFALLSVWIAAQLRVEAVKHDLGQNSPTKRLTNLGNALNRYYDRSGDVEALESAKDIHETVLDYTATLGSAIDEARARLNLGNTYTRMGSYEGIEAGRHWNGRAVDTYAPGIERLRIETGPENEYANRLMTGLIAQMAQSLLVSPGDEYLNHRKAIANLTYAENSFSDRLSEQRGVEFFLANVGARIQIIDRLALPEQQEPNVAKAIEIFEREAPGAVSRRPAPDTALGVHMAGASLYAFRGSLTGNAEDCTGALGHLREADNSIAVNLAINADRLVYGVGAVLDCIVDTAPETRGLDRLDPRRLEAKQNALGELNGDDALPAFTADERAALWLTQTGDPCTAAEIMFQQTDSPSRVRFPEFWHLTAVGYECRGEDPSRFIADVRDWLTEREQAGAQSRSGHALIARADRDELTDLAIALASQGRFEDTLWLLDYANRSRMSPGLERARDRMERASANAAREVASDIVTWLEYDNPADPDRSFEISHYSNGQVHLLSEAIAARLSLARTPPTPSVRDVLANLEAVTQHRIMAWFLLGGRQSGWLIAHQTDAGLNTSFVRVHTTRADVQAIFSKTHIAPATQATGTFFDARQDAGQSTEGDLAPSIELWQTALANTSSEIAQTVVAPLYDALADIPPFSGQTDRPLVTLVVRNAVADLPLHSISVGNAARGCGEMLIDCFLVTWSGHAGSVQASIQEPLDFEAVPTFWGFEAADLGGKSLASYAQVLSGGKFQVTSKPAEVLNTLTQGPVGLWVLHGEYDPLNPGASAFGLQPGHLLTGASVLGAPPISADRRLQVLIGCQSALFDQKVQPTEQTGLAEPFHQIGIDAVIVASWNAETLMSRVFTGVLFEKLNAQASPAAAYRQAVLFLRAASVRDLVPILDPQGNGRNLEPRTLDLLAQMARRFGNEPPMADLTRLGAFRLVEG